MHYQLAQVNIASMRARLMDESMLGLASRMDEMNRIAASSDGFVWRLPGISAADDALQEVAHYLGGVEPERIFYNLSVWQNPEDLRRYVYRTRHNEMLQAKHDWLASLDDSGPATIALWWIPADHRPTIQESLGKLRAVTHNGPTKAAFTLSRTFSPPDPDFDSRGLL